MESIPTREQIDAIDLTIFEEYVEYSNHKEFFYDKEGQEHYKLLAAISQQAEVGSVLIDVGTYKGFSALALSYNPCVQVLTYDMDKESTYKKILEKENINFMHMNCFDDMYVICQADFIMLDIDPHDGIQEERFIREIEEAGYRGMIICDDIHLNKPMNDMWKNIKKHKLYDISQLGHKTGTGLIHIR